MMTTTKYAAEIVQTLITADSVHSTTTRASRLLNSKVTKLFDVFITYLCADSKGVRHSKGVAIITEHSYNCALSGIHLITQFFNFVFSF